LRLFRETVEPLAPTRFLIDVVHTDAVIPVVASLAGGKDGRRIDMRYPERLQVRKHRTRIVKGKLRRQLEAIGRGGNCDHPTCTPSRLLMVVKRSTQSRATGSPFSARCERMSNSWRP